MELLRKGLRKHLDNGDSIHLFTDPWLPRPYSFKVLMTNGESDCRMVNDFITPSLQWNIPMLEASLCPNDVALISTLAISPSAPDTWIWHFDKHGKYTVRSGYKVYMMGKIEASSSESGKLKKWWKVVWSLKVPTKIKNFIWRAFHDCSNPSKFD